VSTLGFRAGTAEDRLMGSPFLPPHLTGAFCHDFLRNFLPELLEDVDLQTIFHLWFMHYGAPPLFLFFFCSGILERVSETMDATTWTNSMASSFP